METIHTADRVFVTWDAEPVEHGAVVVGGDRIGAVGPYDDLRARFPRARVRTWPGDLGPARSHDGPLPAAPSPRERVHAVLKLGAVAVLAQYVDSPGLRAGGGAQRRGGAPGYGPEAGDRRNRPGRLGGVRRGGSVQVATVCAGRLVHRRR